MRDLAYVLGTLGFFGLMLGYVRACAALGRVGAAAPTTRVDQGANAEARR